MLKIEPKADNRSRAFVILSKESGYFAILMINFLRLQKYEKILRVKNYYFCHRFRI